MHFLLIDVFRFSIDNIIDFRDGFFLLFLQILLIRDLCKMKNMRKVEEIMNLRDWFSLLEEIFRIDQHIRFVSHQSSIFEDAIPTYIVRPFIVHLIGK